MYMIVQPNIRDEPIALYLQRRVRKYISTLERTWNRYSGKLYSTGQVG